MANYPQLDDCSGVWTLKEVNDAVMGGYWREAGAKGLVSGDNSQGTNIEPRENWFSNLKFLSNQNEL